MLYLGNVDYFLDSAAHLYRQKGLAYARDILYTMLIGQMHTKFCQVFICQTNLERVPTEGSLLVGKTVLRRQSRSNRNYLRYEAGAEIIFLYKYLQQSVWRILGGRQLIYTSIETYFLRYHCYSTDLSGTTLLGLEPEPGQRWSRSRDKGGAGAGTKVEPEPKINYFNSATQG